jgi:hypothetical protein
VGAGDDRAVKAETFRKSTEGSPDGVVLDQPPKVVGPRRPRAI